MKRTRPSRLFIAARQPLVVFAVAASCLLTACVSRSGEQAPGTETQQAGNPSTGAVSAAILPLKAGATNAAEATLNPPQPPPDKRPDVVFVPTPQDAVERMLELARIKPGELIYDLGCGDGRIVVTAAKKYGVRAIGVDIDPQRVAESRENVRTNNVGHLVTILHADIFQLDFSKADVVTLYLLPDLNVKLKPQLRKLKPGSRIISYDFDMRGAKPAVVLQGSHEGEYNDYTIYKWVVPWVEEE